MNKEFKPDEKVTLISTSFCPAQRAHVVEDFGNDSVLVCVIPHDREPGDEDGLTEIPPEDLRKGWAEEVLREGSD